MDESDVVSRYTNEQAIADGVKMALPHDRVFATTNLVRQIFKPLLDAYNSRPDKDNRMVTVKVEIAVGAEGRADSSPIRWAPVERVEVVAGEARGRARGVAAAPGPGGPLDPAGG
jgi:hypothetical protein